MDPPTDFTEFIEEGKNKFAVVCNYCKSRMLNPKAAQYVNIQYKMPFMTQKKSEVSVDNGEDLNDYWIVDDMYTFENIGFTHTVGDIKYLTCADCERGPVGYHILSTKTSYLALARVNNRE